jgi:hypothetical protein
VLHTLLPNKLEWDVVASGGKQVLADRLLVVSDAVLQAVVLFSFQETHNAKRGRVEIGLVNVEIGLAERRFQLLRDVVPGDFCLDLGISSRITLRKKILRGVPPILGFDTPPRTSFPLSLAAVGSAVVSIAVVGPVVVAAGAAFGAAPTASEGSASDFKHIRWRLVALVGLVLSVL